MQRPRAESSEERIDEAIDACGEYILYAGSLFWGCYILLIGVNRQYSDLSDSDCD